MVQLSLFWRILRYERYSSIWAAKLSTGICSPTDACDGFIIFVILVNHRLSSLSSSWEGRLSSVASQMSLLHAGGHTWWTSKALKPPSLSSLSHHHHSLICIIFYTLSLNCHHHHHLVIILWRNDLQNHQQHQCHGNPMSSKINKNQCWGNLTVWFSTLLNEQIHLQREITEHISYSWSSPW